MQVPLVRVTILIGLFTKTRLTMRMPLVRVTPVNQFSLQNCLDKLALDNVNATRASDCSKVFFHRNRIENLNLNI